MRCISARTAYIALSVLLLCSVLLGTVGALLAPQ